MGTTKKRYKNIEFSLNNNGLKHMIEYLDEKVVLTTIHSAKGLGMGLCDFATNE